MMRGRPLLTGPLDVRIKAYVSIPVSKSKKWRERALAGSVFPVKKPDGDNVIKGLLDALNLIVWVDDCQAVDITFTKRYSENPRIEIFISEIVNT